MPRRECKGRDDGQRRQDCCYRADGSGRKAQAPRGRYRCSFCDKVYMASLCADHDYATVLRQLKGFPEHLQQKAMEYIPDDQKAFFQDKLTKAKRCKGEACDYALTLRGGRAQTMGKRLL